MLGPLLCTRKHYARGSVDKMTTEHELNPFWKKQIHTQVIHNIDERGRRINEDKEYASG